MSEPKSAPGVGRNAASLFTAQIANFAVAFVFGVFVARMLGVDEFGRFTFVLAIYAILTIFVNLGLHSLVVREIARTRDAAGHWLSGALALKLVSVGSASALLAIAVAVTPGLRPLWVPLMAVAAALFLDAISDVVTIAFQAFERFAEPAVLSVVGTLAWAAAGLACLAAGFGYVELVLAMVAAKLVQAALALTLLGTRLPAALVGLGLPDARRLVGLLRSAAPFFVSKLFYLLYFRIDMIMLEALVGDTAVGLYGVAYKFVNAAGAGAAAVSAAVFPALSAAGGTEAGRRLVRDSVRFMFVTGLLASLLVWAFAPDLLRVVFGDEYLPAVTALAILGWTLLPLFANHVFSNVLLSIDRERAAMGIGALALVVNVGLNVVLIPRHAEVGAAAATLVSEVAVAAAYLFLLARAGALQLSWIRAPRLAACGALLCGGVLLVRDVNVPVAGAVGVAVYVAALLALRVVRWSELGRLARGFRPSTG